MQAYKQKIIYIGVQKRSFSIDMPKQVPNIETTNKVKDYFEQNPTKSVRKAQKALGIPKATVNFSAIMFHYICYDHSSILYIFT